MRRTRPLAVVTGARRGAGASIAVALAGSGFDLALADLTDDGAEEMLDAVAERDALATMHVFDLASLARHGAILDRIEAEQGPISCLVNGVNIEAPSPSDLLDVEPATLDQVLDVNLRGTFFFTQAVARRMAAASAGHPRSIVTVSRASSDPLRVDHGERCLSEAGVGMMTKLFALRLAPLGISVFEVRPDEKHTHLPTVVAAMAGGCLPLATGSVWLPSGNLSHLRS